MSSLAACYLQTLAKLPRTLATLPNADEKAAKERENTDRVVDKYLLHPRPLPSPRSFLLL